MLRALILLSTISWVAPVQAEPAVALGLKELVSLAQARSEKLALAQTVLDQAYAKRRQAVGEWLPQVGLKASEAFADKGNTSFQSPAARLNARQDFLKGLDQPAALLGGEALVANAMAQLKAAELAVLKETGDAYFAVLTADEQVAAEQSLQQVAQDSVKELKDRVALGRNRRAELSSAEAQAARVQAALSALQGQSEQAREALASLCGIDMDAALAPLGDAAAAGMELKQAEAAVDALPALKAAREALAQAKAERLAVRGGFMPSLYAEGNWNLARQNGAVGPDWDAVLGLDLPLFKGGAQLAKLKSADAAVRAAELRLALAQREATREARQAWRGFKQSLNRAEATRLALLAAEKSLQDQQKDFRNALVTQLDMLQAFQTVENARLENVNARYDAHRAGLRLKIAVGAAQD